MKVIVMMPLRDDWTSVATLIRRLDRAMRSAPCDVEVLIVDDGSLTAWNAADVPTDVGVVQAIRVLRLRRNLGHQRAIAIGLAYIEQHVTCDAVLVMDADGQDSAEGAARLVRRFAEIGGSAVVFAERRRRSESLVFQTGYHLYRGLHRVLTGRSVRVGNFSIVPSGFLGTLVVMSELWNHYSAAVFRSRLPYTMIPIPRDVRIDGSSSMNLVDMTAHGLSAMSVFGDIVGVRLLIASVAGSVLAAFGIVAIWIRALRTAATPPAAAYLTGTLAIIIIQLLTIATSFTFFMLSSRRNMDFVPLRDYTLFVAGLTTVFSRAAANV